MDERAALVPGMAVYDKSVEYKVTGITGRGSNSIVYEAEYKDAVQPEFMHHVLLKELFPFDEKGRIYRKETGEIVCGEEVREFYELHKRSFLRGNRFHLELQKKKINQASMNINSFSANGTLYTILGFSEGITLKKAIETGMISTLSDAVYCILHLLEALKIFHRNGLLHLDISPDNILLLPLEEGASEQQRQVFLIDYNSTWSVQELRECETDLYFSKKEQYSSPEVIMQRPSEISEASDLFTVCMVFYECIFSETPEDSWRKEGGKLLVDKNLGLLEGSTETVQQKTISILHKGLRIAPKQRYQSIAALRDDLLELQQRISGTGITHGALWEASARDYRRQIENNPVYAYLQEETLFHELTAAELNREENSILLGTGGIGKTTCLLHLWRIGVQSYRPNYPVPIYFPLHCYRPGNVPYIQSQILSSLRFKTDSVTVQDALQKLQELFDTPLVAADGNHACVWLLIDGLNEVKGDISPLISEMEELLKKRGVRIILTSRGAGSALPFRKIEVLPLTKDQVNTYLMKRNLFAPTDEDLLRLLQNPMMLTIYEKLCQEKKYSLAVHEKQELLEEYIGSLMDKVKQKEPSEELEQQLSYAMDFLLPEFAEKMKKRQELTKEECYLLTEQNFFLLQTSSFFRIFPEYAGKSRAILNGCKNAEQWFEKMIISLLQKELSLLMTDQNGAVRFFHQNFYELFKEKGTKLKKRLRRVKRRKLRKPQPLSKIQENYL